MPQWVTPRAPARSAVRTGRDVGDNAVMALEDLWI
jgi:hypothetical protein